MDSQTLNHGSAPSARTALDALGVVGGVLIAYLAVGILLEAFTSINVPFIVKGANIRVASQAAARWYSWMRPEGFQNAVHAAARWYSWISPPSRSRRLISPRLGGASVPVRSGVSSASPR
jgi:hypothetical protein